MTADCSAAPAERSRLRPICSKLRNSLDRSRESVAEAAGGSAALGCCEGPPSSLPSCPAVRGRRRTRVQATAAQALPRYEFWRHLRRAAGRSARARNPSAASPAHAATLPRRARNFPLRSAEGFGPNLSRTHTDGIRGRGDSDRRLLTPFS